MVKRISVSAVHDLLATPPVFVFTATSNNIGSVQSAGNDLFEIQFGEITEQNRINASYDSSNGRLTLTTGNNDLMLTAQFNTLGTGAATRTYFWRDVSQSVGTRFGTAGTFGQGSPNIAATAIVPANTSIVLDVRSASSGQNQRLQAGSFIRVEEV